MATCLLCGDTPPDGGFANHLRLLHPDAWQDIARWADESVVIHDITLEPADFNKKKP